MEIDLRKSLELACQHLDRFAVPGVGLFRKVYQGAQVDHRNGTILPPTETFSLEKEGARIDAAQEIENFVNFLFQQFKTTLECARDAARDLGELIREELDTDDRFEIPGVGEIQMNEVGEMIFQPSGGLNALVGNQYFGLQSVGYTLGNAASIETVEKQPVKEEIAKPLPVTRVSPTGKIETPVKAVEKPKEPAKEEAEKPVPVAQKATQPEATQLAPPEEPPKKKRKGWKILIVLSLIWGLIFVGILFRNEIAQFADGLFSKKPDTTLTDGTGTDTETETEIGIDPETETETTTDPETETTSETDPEIVPETEVIPETETEVFSGEAGEAPVRGQHYLVVAASKNGNYAEQLARRYRKAPYSAKAIAPTYPGGYYKISIYNASDKMEVIQKMVEWKETFKEGTWIYSAP